MKMFKRKNKPYKFIMELPGIPGTYCDRDILLLHTSFGILKDFIEIECAHMYCNSKNIKPVKPGREFGLKYVDFFRFYKSDPDELCIREDNEKYEQKIQTTWKEFYDLYIWWVDVYTNQKCPMDESGCSEYYNYIEKKYGAAHNMTPIYGKNKHRLYSKNDWLDVLHELKGFYFRDALKILVSMYNQTNICNYYLFGGYTDEENKQLKDFNKKVDEIGQHQYNEEQEMLKRLIDIRQIMWT